MDIVFATENAGKMKEIREILGDGYTVRSMKEAGIDLHIEEDGLTFEENALIKARAVAPYTNAVVLADDSGFVIDALGGEPGIYSARYLGEDVPFSEKCASFLSRMEGREDRTAHFVCVIAAVLPDGRTFTAEGLMDGEVAFESRGDGGFGYDPIFYIPAYGRTAAELTMDEKNAISHRGVALRKMKEILETL